MAKLNFSGAGTKINISRFIIFIALGLFLYAPCLRAKSGGDCQLLLSYDSGQSTPTGNFMAYIRALMDGNVIDVPELKYFAKNLKEGRIVNPISEDLAREEYEAGIHWAGLQKQIDSEGNLDIFELKNLAEEELARREIVGEKRESIRRETQEVLDPGGWHEERWWQKAAARDLKYIDPNKEVRGEGPLYSYTRYAIHFAAEYAPPKTLKMFLQMHGETVNAKNNYGNNALVYVIGDNEKMDILIEAGIDVNSKNKNKEIALIHAVRFEDEESIVRLIEAGSDVNIKTSYGESALTQSAEKGNKKIFKILRKAGGKFSIARFMGLWFVIAFNRFDKRFLQ